LTSGPPGRSLSYNPTHHSAFLMTLKSY